jgi:hypothetical protein
VLRGVSAVPSVWPRYGGGGRELHIHHGNRLRAKVATVGPRSKRLHRGCSTPQPGLDSGCEVRPGRPNTRNMHASYEYASNQDTNVGTTPEPDCADTSLLALSK